MKKKLLPAVTISLIEEELERRRLIAKRLKTVKSISITLIVVAAITVLIATIWLPVMQVHGRSMEPVLHDGEILVALRGERFIRRGDIIAFYYNDQVLLKRAIGFPGEKINIDDDGNIYVDGKLLDEPYIEKKAKGNCDVELPVTVGENSLFVLGDKRAVSIDSRSQDMGMIFGERTIGKIVFRVWGFDVLGPINKKQP